jgi:hypothetical protein
MSFAPRNNQTAKPAEGPLVAICQDGSWYITKNPSKFNAAYLNSEEARKKGAQPPKPYATEALANEAIVGKNRFTPSSAAASLVSPAPVVASVSTATQPETKTAAPVGASRGPRQHHNHQGPRQHPNHQGPRQHPNHRQAQRSDPIVPPESIALMFNRFLILTSTIPNNTDANSVDRTINEANLVLGKFNEQKARMPELLVESELKLRIVSAELGRRVTALSTVQRTFTDVGISDAKESIQFVHNMGMSIKQLTDDSNVLTKLIRDIKVRIAEIDVYTLIFVAPACLPSRVVSEVVQGSSPNDSPEASSYESNEETLDDRLLAPSESYDWAAAGELEAALGSVAVNSVPQVTNADASPVDAGLE